MLEIFITKRYHFIKKTVSLAVLFFFILHILPLNLAAAAAAEPLDTTESLEDQEDSTEPREQLSEIIEKRTETSKTFDNGDGTFTGHLYPGPIHFLEEGKWKEFDNTITPSANGEFVNQANPFKARFGSRGKSPVITSYEYQDYKIEYSLADLPGMGSKFFLDTKDVVPRVEENVITYEEIFPGVDLRQIVFDHGIKEDFILKEYTGKNSFVFSFKMTGIEALKEDNGSIGFYRKDTGEKVFTIPKPYMVDSNMDEELGEGVISEDVEAGLLQVGSNLYITITADETWLASPERVYPVYIDPTTTLQADADAYVSDAAPNSNFDARWNSNGYYTLNTGYYDSTTGTCHTYIKFDTSPISGKLVTSATLNKHVLRPFLLRLLRQRGLAEHCKRFLERDRHHLEQQARNHCPHFYQYREEYLGHLQRNHSRGRLGLKPGSLH